MMSSEVRITIIADNLAARGLSTEHGLALWIEAVGKRILFDTGQGITLEENARELGIDLSGTDMIVLSHGHYDHTGGISRVLRLSRNAVVYGHPGIVHPRYAVRNGTATAIHMPRESMAALDRLPSEKLRWIQQSVLLPKNIGLTGPIPRETGWEDTGGPFYLDPKGTRVDPIDDDLAFWIPTGKGVVLCVGCSHGGLVNTLNHVRRLSGDLPIRAVVGGFHLVNASRERLDRTVEALRRLDPEQVIPCHCTGPSAVARLVDELGERVTPGAAGMTFTF